MKPFLLIISLLLSALSFCQIKTVAEIDSSLRNNQGVENFRYWYGTGNNAVADFRMDTILGKLSRFRYTSLGEDTISVDYFFIDNYLVKVHSFRLKQGHPNPLGTYYFNNNRMVNRAGRNVKLPGQGTFKRIAPKHFDGQLEYIYSQYELLNPSKTRYQVNVPLLLQIKRSEIEKQKNYYIN
jgi:hypothetical protein